MEQPVPKSRFGHRSSSYVDCRLWNSIPQVIREGSSIPSFRRKLSKIIPTSVKLKEHSHEDLADFWSKLCAKIIGS